MDLFLWAEWNMNNVSGKYDNGTFFFDTANFKIFFTWTKGIRSIVAICFTLFVGSQTK
jgi:hypothetical protein